MWEAGCRALSLAVKHPARGRLLSAWGLQRQYQRAPKGQDMALLPQSSPLVCAASCCAWPAAWQLGLASQDLDQLPVQWCVTDSGRPKTCIAALAPGCFWCSAVPVQLSWPRHCCRGMGDKAPQTIMPFIPPTFLTHYALLVRGADTACVASWNPRPYTFCLGSRLETCYAAYSCAQPVRARPWGHDTFKAWVSLTP